MFPLRHFVNFIMFAIISEVRVHFSGARDADFVTNFHIFLNMLSNHQ